MRKSRFGSSFTPFSTSLGRISSLNFTYLGLGFGDFMVQGLGLELRVQNIPALTSSCAYSLVFRLPVLSKPPNPKP